MSKLSSRYARRAAPLAVLAVILTCLAAPASATPTTTWNLYQNCSVVVGWSGGCIGDSSSHTSNGNEYSFSSVTSPQLSLTASAYHSSKSSGLGGASFLGEYTGSQYGLGVEDLSAPEHAVDNQSGYDFIVFELPTGSNFDKLQISLSPFGATEDMNATILYGTPAAGLGIGLAPSVTQFAGLSINNLLANGFSAITTTNLLHETNIQTVSIVSPNIINYFIVAASLTPGHNEHDYFKVNSVTAIDTPSPVPEPASLALLAAGLFGIVSLRMRAAKA